MNFLWPLVAVILLYSTSVSCISMELKRKSKIFQECYVRERSGSSYNEMNAVFINGQIGSPLASSVENLIGLIEKLENSTRYTDRPNQAKDLAAAILRKFRSDGNVVRSFSRLEQDEIHGRLDQIENALLDDTQGTEFDDEKDLTTNERCSLYFMLSYHINETEKGESRSGSRGSNVMRAPPLPSSVRGTGQPRYGNQGINFAPVALTSKPREYGVGSFRGNTDQAIALNRLLLGVIAGQLKSPELSVRDVLYKIHPEYSAEEIRVKQDGLIDPLIAVTLGNIHAMAAHAYDEPEKIATTGSWDSAMCTLEYTLRSAGPSDATLANIRGGLDGYKIGEMVRTLSATPAGQRLRLSQILRFFYDNVGARSFGSGYCTRTMANIDTRSIRETATNYLRVLEAAKDYTVDEQEIVRNIERLGPSMDSAYGKAKAIPGEDSEWCSKGESSGYQAVCETPTDLIVALDMTDESKDRFKNLTARLAQNLNFGAFGSSMTVLSLNRESDIGQDGQVFKNNLKHIAWASTNKACPACALQYLREENFGNMITAPSTDLYLRINDTLRDFEMMKQNQAGVPAKPFLLMGGNYQSRNVDENIRMARYKLKTNHRDVPIILLTNANPEDLSEYVQSPQDIIREEDTFERTAEVLAARLCEVPATFQHPDCIRPSSEANNYYEGLITPGRTQFWAMYPEYFLKSFTINMKFTSTEGRLKVCFSRSPKPEDTGLCLENDKDPEFIHFTISDPCKDRDVRTCEPFYFQVTAIDQQMQSNNFCSDKRCLNAKQIKFKFAHQGMQCSGAMSQFSSLTLYFTSILVLFSVYNRNFKQF